MCTKNSGKLYIRCKTNKLRKMSFTRVLTILYIYTTYTYYMYTYLFLNKCYYRFFFFLNFLEKYTICKSNCNMHMSVQDLYYSIKLRGEKLPSSNTQK